jgi:manganese-dependent inorganic pyrophosphatase
VIHTASKRLFLILALLFSSCLGAAPVFVGHQVPDTDSIAAAIGAAELMGGVAVRQGEMNAETRFALNRFAAEPPALMADFSNHAVFLLDHNEASQSSPTINAENVLGIIDHHSLGEHTFKPPSPVLVDIRPWGSACSIVADRFRIAQLTPSKATAGMLLSGILSDTLVFRSPTTTAMDQEQAAWLASIAGVDQVQSYGLELLQAKSNVAGLSDDELLLSDYKEYDVGGRRVGFGSIETVSPELILARQAGLMKAMSLHKTSSHLDLLFLAVVDVLEQNATLLLLEAEETAIAQRIYGGAVVAEAMALPGYVSRKRQFMPPLIKHINEGLSR